MHETRLTTAVKLSTWWIVICKYTLFMCCLSQLSERLHVLRILTYIMLLFAHYTHKVLLCILQIGILLHLTLTWWNKAPFVQVLTRDQSKNPNVEYTALPQWHSYEWPRPSGPLLKYLHQYQNVKYKCYFVHTTTWLLSVRHMVDRESHCISLQCEKIRVHQCLLYCMPGTDCGDWSTRSIMMTVKVCHQITIVLSGPGWWASGVLWLLWSGRQR